MSDRHRDPLAATVAGEYACDLVRVVRPRHLDSSPVDAPPERQRQATPSTSKRHCCTRAMPTFVVSESHRSMCRDA